MKTLNTICAVLILGISAAAVGGYYIPSNEEIDSWSQQWVEPGTVSTTMDTSYAFGADFDAALNDEEFAGFWKAAYGIQFATSLDLSGYDGYRLGIKNTHPTDSVSVNIFTNDGTGWTYVENGWTWIDPGESAWLTIETSQWGDPADIRKIGFQYGTNGPNSTETYKGSYISVQSLPEPATMTLLALGGLLLRKRR